MPRALHEVLMLHFKMIPLIYESCKSFQKYTFYIFNIYTIHKPCIRYEWTLNPCWTEDKRQKIVIKEPAECAWFLSNQLFALLNHLIGSNKVKPKIKFNFRIGMVPSIVGIVLEVKLAAMTN